MSDEKVNQVFDVCAQDTHLHGHTASPEDEFADDHAVREVESVDDPYYLLEQPRPEADLWQHQAAGHWQAPVAQTEHW